MTRPLLANDKKRKRTDDVTEVDGYEEFMAMKKLKLSTQDEYVGIARIIT